MRAVKEVIRYMCFGLVGYFVKDVVLVGFCQVNTSLYISEKREYN